MVVLWHFVFHVVAEWLPDFQRLQRCPTEKERDSRFLKFNRRNSLLVVSQLLSPLDHQQDWVPSPLLGHHWQGIQANQGWPLSHMPQEVGFKNQPRPRLWGKGEKGLAAGTANTSAPGPAFPPSPDLLSLVSPPFHGKALDSCFTCPSLLLPTGLACPHSCCHHSELSMSAFSMRL